MTLVLSQAYEMPMRQVAEWQHNKTTIQRQLRIIQQICEYSVVEGGVHEDSIYYSIENNTPGEAALVMLEEMGEENIYGTMLTEPQNLDYDDYVEDLPLHTNQR